MTHAAAETRTLQVPAVGHESRRRGSAPAHCRHPGPTLRDGDHVNFFGGPIINSSLQRASQIAPCLVCLSTHGRGRLAGTVVGSTARDIILTSTAPALVVPVQAVEG